MSKRNWPILFVLLSSGFLEPLIIKNYPLDQAALARAAPDDPQCAARFEPRELCAALWVEGPRGARADRIHERCNRS